MTEPTPRVRLVPALMAVCGLCLLVFAFLAAFTTVGMLAALLGVALLGVGGALLINRAFPPKRRG